jgi:hypothetical protein
MKHTNFSPLWISQNTQIEKHIKNLNHVNVMCEDKLKKKKKNFNDHTCIIFVGKKLETKAVALY